MGCRCDFVNVNIYELKFLEKIIIRAYKLRAKWKYASWEFIKVESIENVCFCNKRLMRIISDLCEFNLGCMKTLDGLSCWIHI